MKLTARLLKEFDSGIRNRGDHYYRSRMVRVAGGSQWEVTANVGGADSYEVRLRRESSQLFVHCDCPYYEANGPCKHLWAVIMVAEDKGYLKGEGDYGKVTLVADDVVEPYRLDDDDEYFSHDDQDDHDDHDEDADDDDDEPPFKSAAPPGPAEILASLPRRSELKPSSAKAGWRKQLAELQADGARPVPRRNEVWPEKRQLLYVIDVTGTLAGTGLFLEVFYRNLRKDGEWGRARSTDIPREIFSLLPDAADQQILATLAGAKELYSAGHDYRDAHWESTLPFRYRLLPPQPELVLPLICRTGRCRLRLQPASTDWLPVAWDDGEPWRFVVEVRRHEQQNYYVVNGKLRRGVEEMELSAPVLLTDAGIVFTRERAARCDHGGAFRWVALLRKHGTLIVPLGQELEFLQELLQQPVAPPLSLPPELHYEETQLTPQPHLKIKKPAGLFGAAERLRGELSFAYDGELVAQHDPMRGVFKVAQRRLLPRAWEFERKAAERLTELGFKYEPSDRKQPSRWELPAGKLPRAARELVTAGWHLEAEGKVFRRPGEFKLGVTSGVDWFELHGEVEYEGGVKAQLPDLLRALRSGEKMVKLGDGTFGMLPEEWLEKYGLLAGLGTVEKETLRFKRTQVGLLDALLAAQPDIHCDESFARARAELSRFAGIAAAAQPAGFVGELRGYQKEGLGWMEFLRRFGCGGCLADDMGVGKTPQVLALLEARRALRAQQGAQNGAAQYKPSLVVVPKSLVFNWMQEAARFTPQLRILDHTGLARTQVGAHFADYDVILTTYGTLRSDAAEFRDLQFDYLVLDEAQAIKNANTVSAKAARLLRGDHRLALSGTPIENHLGELWSLFEFLNPGMLGAGSVFKLTGAGARNPDEETRKLLAHALRPFILRRTKEQVATELPPKLEQTLYCELEPPQRKLYNELRDHYRGTLLKRIETEGLNKSRMQILEALLRLRQAAIHPGLIDKARAAEPSAKLDLLLDQLHEVIAGEHKALVFSQFTSMLTILRDRLDRAGIAYEYLDGRTRDRQARVEGFQNDPACKLFLISLKAGGLGLNLTAAEYVFLLDPWWNPAVEAQAIDRAHRIGQNRQVFAYRLIARDTVEEKVVELQNTKRDLAEAIINADNSLIRNLGQEDLALLLS